MKFSRRSFVLLATAFVTLAIVGSTALHASEAGKPVTLAGEVGCAKCAFNSAKECATALRVTEGEKQVIYLFDSAAHKTHHAGICEAPKKATVTGTVHVEGDKHYITVTKVEYAK